MILCIADVLTAQELCQVQADLERTVFLDGQLSAGWHARRVKHNTQAKTDAQLTRQLEVLVRQALRRNALFNLAVRPKAIRPLLFNRYDQAMKYGTHVDDAVMGDMNPVRSDISMTLFLSNPLDYDGGELVIETTAGEQDFKLDAGAMVIYPSTMLHRVEPVTRGTRLAAVTWIQSLVRDAARRELLFDLDTARRMLFEKHGKTREFDLLSKSLANLLRMWAEV
jgi:PKHD-type hydroxylase